jgi:2-keto-4-pentenoate hydratase/2-oxohepta-3-ene-1,7-dioic acid hydratase in catechol pathway
MIAGMENPTFARVVTPSGDRWVRVEGERLLFLDRAPWEGGATTGDDCPREGAVFGCPLAPRKVFGIGKNYRAHAKEMGGTVPDEPLVFAKAATSLLGPGGTVLLPRESARVDYEGELGVVIGTRCRRVPADRALDHVFGYTVVCDVTARDLQTKDGQWTRAKGFDTFCPAGPVVVAGLEPSGLDLSLRVNGVIRQHASTGDMIFDVARIVAHVSAFSTLEPGDLIATGTPEGIGPLAPGDVVEVRIEGIGSLGFSVAREP